MAVSGKWLGPHGNRLGLPEVRLHGGGKRGGGGMGQGKGIMRRQWDTEEDRLDLGRG